MKKILSIVDFVLLYFVMFMFKNVYAAVGTALVGTNGGVILSDAIRMVYSREIEFKA